MVCSGKPIFTQPRLSDVSLALPLKQFRGWSDWRQSCLTLFNGDCLALLSTPFSSGRSTVWCPGLGFVPGHSSRGGNAGWTMSKSGYPCPCQNCSYWPPAEKTARGSLLNLPSCPTPCQEAQLWPCCHVMSFCEWTKSRGGIVTSRRQIGMTSFLFFISASFFFFNRLLCWDWQLSGRFFFFFLAVADSIEILSARWGYVFSLYLMFCSVVVRKPPCVSWDCRLSVVRSVPMLTAEATVIFDSPALHPTLFHSVLHSKTFWDSANCFLLTSSPWFRSSSFLRPPLLLGQK